MRLHSISAGDVVRAFRLLDARDEETRVAIARVLGFDLQAESHCSAIGRPMRNDEKPQLERPSEEPLFNPNECRKWLETQGQSIC